MVDAGNHGDDSDKKDFKEKKVNREKAFFFLEDYKKIYQKIFDRKKNQLTMSNVGRNTAIRTTRTAGGTRTATRTAGGTRNTTRPATRAAGGPTRTTTRSTSTGTSSSRTATRTTKLSPEARANRINQHFSTKGVINCSPATGADVVPIVINYPGDEVDQCDLCGCIVPARIKIPEVDNWVDTDIPGVTKIDLNIDGVIITFTRSLDGFKEIISWTSTHKGVRKIILKGVNLENIYAYDGQLLADNNLQAPVGDDVVTQIDVCFDLAYKFLDDCPLNVSECKYEQTIGYNWCMSYNIDPASRDCQDANASFDIKATVEAAEVPGNAEVTICVDKCPHNECGIINYPLNLCQLSFYQQGEGEEDVEVYPIPDTLVVDTASDPIKIKAEFLPENIPYKWCGEFVLSLRCASVKKTICCILEPDITLADDCRLLQLPCDDAPIEITPDTIAENGYSKTLQILFEPCDPVRTPVP